MVRGRDGSFRASAEVWSIERRLPIFISLLLACAVGGISLAAYREVRATAISRATDRLERVGHELALSSARTTVARTDVLNAAARDGEIIRALTSAVAPAVVQARLTAAREPGDSTLIGWQVAAIGRESRYSSGAGWSSTDSAMLATTLAAMARSGVDERSVLYAVGDRVHTWAAVPILVAGRPVGAVAELRRVGDASGADATIRGLVDDEARLLFTSQGSNVWVTTRGHPIAAPFILPAVESRAASVTMAGVGQYAAQFAIPKTPWVIVLHQSEASVLRRPVEFLWRILLAGSVMLAVATLVAWLLSRHVTRPLRDITDAAAALAHGDYARRVSVSGGGREVASLSATFNAMAAGIGDAHATLADRNAKLQRANAAKAQFLAMMSHELRTPLNAIGGFTELMELGLRGPVTAEQVVDLGRIRRNKDLLLSIITDILEFTRADAGVLNVKLAPIAIAPLLTDVVDAMGRQMEAKGVRLVRGAVPADAIARGDREKVQQVMLNLVSNAMKFTDSGGEVAVETSVADDTVRIDVRDTGAGIRESELEAIFEPFVQVDASLTRRAGGTGLGLAISRQLAGAMGGTVTVRSTVGVGSTFSLILPHTDRPTVEAAVTLGPPLAAGQTF
ncbi:MAG: HAMP domain-containing sensor histidine kinase [bacterium]